jgi:diguanylate cyclase (GGDEF)-like protein
MNDLTSILLILLVATNLVLVAFVVSPSILRQRRERRYADSLQPVASDVSPRERIYSPATTLVDDSPAPSRTDTLTGLLLPSEWKRILGDEDARVRRYGRPATIVLIELDGLDRLIGALGQGAGNRLVVAVADTLSRHERSADQLARLDVGRFGILLPETGEIEAVNYVERVREACDLWLASGAISLRLAIGWAAPPIDGTLNDAIAMAEERVLADQERNRVAATQAPAPAPASQTTTDLAGWPSPA